MASINLDMQQHIDSGFLRFSSSRPTLYGLEMHLVAIHKAIKKFRPTVVVLDPITNLVTIGTINDVKAMLVRLVDFLLDEQITVMFTALSINNTLQTQTAEDVSSLVDCWIQVKDIEQNGERNRGLYIMKSRGMKHSNQVREFVMTNEGLDLIDVYLGPDGVLTGSAREAQILYEETGELLHSNAVIRKDRELTRRKRVLEAKIENLKSEFESAEEELNKVYVEEDLKKKFLDETRQKITEYRKGESSNTDEENINQ